MPGKRRKSGVCTMNAAENPIVSGIKEEKKGYFETKNRVRIWEGAAALIGLPQILICGKRRKHNHYICCMAT